ncbi:MAG: TIGR02206 family membrane protein [Roseimicrobium sp.]
MLGDWNHPSPFVFGGSPHVAVLVATAFLAGCLVALRRWRMDRVAHSAEVVLGTILLLVWPARVAVLEGLGSLTLANGLPCHLCDLAAILGGFALLTRNRWAAELLYFWGLAATWQGLITPAVAFDWPHPEFVVFVMLHAGVVIAAVHVTWGMRLTPRKGAVLRAMGWLAVYAGLAGIVNLAVGSEIANYGFLCSKPPSASLLDHLGPWPWYIGSIGLVALACFTLLDLPFWALRKAEVGQPHALR